MKTKPKNISLLLPLLLFLFLQFSCSKPNEPSKPPTPPPPPLPERQVFTIIIEEVSCTEAWLKVTVDSLPLPANIVLLCNNKLAEQFTITIKDTLLYIDSLLPKQTYNIKARSTTDTLLVSNTTTTNTMDTTSHNFTWQTFTFGQHSSSGLYDVAIIDENNIWAVGEIYMKDSLGNPDPSLYNLLKWDGTSWRPERVYFKNNQGQTFLALMKSIFTFDRNDIWIGLDQIIRWDRIKYYSIEIPNTIFHSWINKMWGSSNSDLYVVGDGGNIAHWDGTKWTKIESPKGTSRTDLHFYDIWGEYNKSKNDYDIYSVAAKRFDNFNKEIFKINKNNTAVLKCTDGIPYDIHGIWFKNKNAIIVGAGMLIKYNIETQSPWKAIYQPITNYYLQAIRGNDINDIFICGDFGELLHYNGKN
jgi:hypothetical protein